MVLVTLGARDRRAIIETNKFLVTLAIDTRKELEKESIFVEPQIILGLSAIVLENLLEHKAGNKENLMLKRLLKNKLNQHR